MITLKQIVIVVLASAVVSPFLFLFVQTGLAYMGIKTAVAGAGDWLVAVSLITIINFLAVGSALLFTALFKWDGVGKPIALTFLLNWGVWMFLPWAIVYANAGGLIPATVMDSVTRLRGWEIVGAIPQYAVLFALYYLPNPAWSWFLSLATFHGFLAILLNKFRKQVTL